MRKGNMEGGEEEKEVIEVTGIGNLERGSEDWNQRLASNSHHPHQIQRHRNHHHHHPTSTQFIEQVPQTEEFVENNQQPPNIPRRSSSNHHRITTHHNHHQTRRPILIEHYPRKIFREEEEEEEVEVDLADDDDFAMKKVVQSAIPSSLIHYKYRGKKNGVTGRGSSSSPRVWSPNASASSSTTSTSLGTTTTTNGIIPQPGHYYSYNVKGQSRGHPPRKGSSKLHSSHPSTDHHHTNHHHHHSTSSHPQPHHNHHHHSVSSVEHIEPRMALSCGAKCAKLLLLIFNAVFWCSGIILFAIGLFFLVEDDRSLLFKLFADESTSYALLQYLAWSFLAIGIAVFVVGFCGCCGALRDSRWMLIVYFVFLLLIFTAELTVGILAVVFQEKVVADLKLELTDKLKKEYGLTSALTAAVDLAQTRFECCGIEGPNDYATSLWKLQYLGGPDATVSKTCCLLLNMKEEQAYINPRPINDTLCQSDEIRYNALYRHQRGCLGKLEHFIRNESLVFIVMGCGLAGVVLFGMVISLCLCRAIGPEDDEPDPHQQ